ncbi:DNA primase [Parabacteroides sp.]
MNLKDQILEKARLEEVVERYLPLRRNGSSGKNLVGLCPFHDDRHPSLHINVKEQYYKCFACGEGGDLFKFVQKMEGCDFRTALKKLAAWYGLSDTGDDFQPVKYLPVKRKKQPVPVEPVSQISIEHLLRSHRMMLDMLMEYIPENEILRETYNAFEVGIAPALLPRDYYYLSGRLVFPIRNERGDLVAFSGRYRGETKGTDIRKYMNSSTSPVYHKSELLYGLYQAQEVIRSRGFVYITEGYKDMLAMHAAGFRNTVALCGTALTEQHILLLKQYTHRAVVMLDGDTAGYINSQKSVALLTEHNFTVERIILQPGGDPDSLLSVMGVTRFVRYIQSSTRRCRLEAYEADLLYQERRLLSDLELALTPFERMTHLASLMHLRRKLMKVSFKLSHSPVIKNTVWCNL